MIRTYAACVAVLLASAQVASAGAVNPKVLVSVPPLKPYVDVLLKGVGSSDSLLRPGQDAHTFTLSPSQRKALDAADVIVLPDRGMSAILDKLLAEEEKRGAKIVTLTSLKGADPLPYPKHNPWLKTAGIDEAKHHEAEKGIDPHVWLDPMRMAAIARPLAEAIGEATPSHSAALKANATDLAFHLREEVSPAVQTIIDRAQARKTMTARPQIPFITYHAAYQYFLKRYRLTSYGQVTQKPEDYLGAKTMHDTLDAGGKLAITCIISETNSPLVQRIATASGARVVPLSPEALYTPQEVPSSNWVRNDYDRLLQKTAISFAECL